MSQQHIQQPPTQQPPSETDLMSNPAKLVKAFGREYQIKRFSMAQVFASVEFVAPFGFVLQNLLSLPRDDQDNLIVTTEQKTQLAITALSISGPSALGLISVATGEPIEWLQMEDKNPIDGIRVLGAVLEKNLDFFTRDNIEEVTKIVNGLTGATLAFSGKTSTT